MKKFLFNFFAAVLIGSVCVGISLWLLNWEVKEAAILGFSVALSGLVLEYLKPVLGNKNKGKLDV